MTDLALLQTIAPGMSPVKQEESEASEPNHEPDDRSAEAMDKVNPLFADLYT